MTPRPVSSYSSSTHNGSSSHIHTSTIVTPRTVPSYIPSRNVSAHNAGSNHPKGSSSAYQSDKGSIANRHKSVIAHHGGGSNSGSHTQALDGISMPTSTLKDACKSADTSTSIIHVNGPTPVSHFVKPAPASMFKTGVPDLITFTKQMSARVNSGSSKHDHESKGSKKGDARTESWRDDADGKTDAKKCPDSKYFHRETDDWKQHQDDQGVVVRPDNRLHVRVHVHGPTQVSLLRDDGDVVDDWEQLDERKIGELQPVAQICSGQDGDVADSWDSEQPEQDEGKDTDSRGIVQVCSADNAGWEQLDQERREHAQQRGIVQVCSGVSAKALDGWAQQGLQKGTEPRGTVQIRSGADDEVVDDWEQLEQDDSKDRQLHGIAQIHSGDSAHVVDDWEQLEQDSRDETYQPRIVQTRSGDSAHIVEDWERLEPGAQKDTDQHETVHIHSRDDDQDGDAVDTESHAYGIVHVLRGGDANFVDHWEQLEQQQDTQKERDMQGKARICSDDDDDVVDHWEERASYESNMHASESMKSATDSQQAGSQLSVPASLIQERHHDAVQKNDQSRVVDNSKTDNSDNSTQQNSEQPPCVEHLTSLEEWDAKWRQVYGTLCAEMGLLEDIAYEEYADGESLLTQEELAAFHAHYGNTLTKARDSGEAKKRLLVACPDLYVNVLNHDMCDQGDDSSDDEF
jgi:hypothetical protein